MFLGLTINNHLTIMKKTLFAMAALALCGTASADMYTASTLETVYPTEFAPTDTPTLIVDASVDYSGRFAPSKPLTLYFNDNFTFSVSGQLGGTVTVSSVQATQAAETHWGEKILEAAGDSYTIVLFDATDVVVGNVKGGTNMQLGGVSKNDSITLGTAAYTYLGYFTTADAAVEAVNTLEDNAVAVAKSGNSIVLVGKSIATAPEPATATLSLLALAGLASRRRRH